MSRLPRGRHAGGCAALPVSLQVTPGELYATRLQLCKVRVRAGTASPPSPKSAASALLACLEGDTELFQDAGLAHCSHKHHSCS